MKKKKENIESIYNILNPDDQKKLLDFAEFLLSRSDSNLREIQSPLAISKPEDEKVIPAIKRLTKQYFMLDKMKLFPLTSQLMSEHLMKGRDSKEVIEELETIFREKYEIYVQEIKDLKK